MPNKLGLNVFSYQICLRASAHNKQVPLASLLSFIFIISIIILAQPSPSHITKMIGLRLVCTSTLPTQTSPTNPPPKKTGKKENILMYLNGKYVLYHIIFLLIKIPFHLLYYYSLLCFWKCFSIFNSNWGWAEIWPYFN